MLRFLVLPLLFTLSAHAAPARSIRLGEANLLEEETPRYFIDVTWAPLLTKQNDTSATPGTPGVNEALGLGLDARATLGYAIDGVYLVGLTYDRYTLGTTRDVRPWGADGMKQALTREEWGPTIGASLNGWRVMLTYFVSGNQRVATRGRNYNTTTSDVTVKNRSLDGFQVSLAYTFRLTPRFELGPTLVYRQVAYHRQARANAHQAADSYDYRPLFVAQRTAALSPMLAAVLRF